MTPTILDSRNYSRRRHRRRGVIMRRSVVIVGTAVTALWAAVGLAWAVNADDPGVQPGPISTTPASWTPPIVTVDPAVEHVDQDDAQAFVARLATDPRGWRTNLGHIAIRIVPAGTNGTQRMPGYIGLAHYDQDLVIISDEAWTTVGTKFAAAGATLDDQRTWVVNHEVGHLLGHHDHEECAGNGPAPVMRANTFGIGACTLNVWPNPWYRP